MSLPRAYEPICHGYGDRREPFIVLEGVSGIGKSTLVELLTARLGASGLHTLPTPHASWSELANGCLRPLPQLAFYLSGVLHAADAVRQFRPLGPVVADRYISSVIACHGAVHGVPVADVERLAAPFLPYLERPDHTFYLRCSQETLRSRLARKAAGHALTEDDRALFDIPGRLQALGDNFAAVAAEDPTAVVLDTDDKAPAELAEWITNHLERSHAEPH